MPCCRGPGKGAGSEGGLDSPGHGRREPGKLRQPEPVAGVPAEARTQGSRGRRQARGRQRLGRPTAPRRSSDRPRTGPRRPGLPAPRSPRAGPNPGLKRSRSGRQPTHAHPAVPRPARRPAPPGLSPYLSLSRAARPSRGLRGASSPPLLNGASSGAPARSDPTNRAGDAPAPGQPSAESSRRRPLARAAAPAGQGSACYK